jgi:CheY-like chemotaxis protein
MGPIVLVSPRADTWGAFATALSHLGSSKVLEARNGAEALSAVREKGPVAMVIDQDLEDMPGKELARHVIQINAMIHLALVSDQPEAIFHEATEGLGILMQLPPRPGRQEAVQLSECLAGVL